MAENPFEPIPTQAPRAAAVYEGPLDVEAVLKEAWRLFLTAPLPLGLASFLAVGVGTAIGVVTAIPTTMLTNAVSGRLAETMEPEFAALVASFGVQMLVTPVNMVIGTLLAWIPMAVALDVVRGETPSFARVLARTGRILPFVGTTVLVQLAATVGYLCFVVPGIMLALGLSLSGYFALDRDLGPIGAIKACWAATDGYKVTIFLLFLAASVIGGLGTVLTCGLGMLVMLPWFQVMVAYLYDRLSRAAADEIPPQP